MTRASAAGVLAAAGLLTACGTATLDRGDVESGIRRTVERRLGSPVAAVDCPARVESRAGGRFTCVVRGRDGTRGDVTVRQTDDEGHVDLRAPFFATGAFARRITPEVEDRMGGGRITVRCPDILVVGVGERFTCRARGGGQRALVRVTRRTGGGVRWDFAS